MATTLNDLKRKAGQRDSVTQTTVTPPPENLPLDTCAFCEQSLFGAFEGVAAGDRTIYMSADQRARMASDAEPPMRFRCRHCGQVIARMPEGRTGQIGAAR